MSGGGGGSADARTSTNQAAERRGVSMKRRGAGWVWLALARLPLLVVALVAILI